MLHFKTFCWNSHQVVVKDAYSLFLISEFIYFKFFLGQCVIQRGVDVDSRKYAIDVFIQSADGVSDGVEFVLVLVAEVMGVVGSGGVGVETLVKFFREANEFFDLFAEFAAEHLFDFFDGGLDVIPLDFGSAFYLFPGIKMVGHDF